MFKVGPSNSIQLIQLKNITIMSNNEQLFAEIIPTEEANLSGGNGGYTVPQHQKGYKGYFNNFANAGGFASAQGGDINLALTDTFAITNQHGAVAGSNSTALSAKS